MSDGGRRHFQDHWGVHFPPDQVCRFESQLPTAMPPPLVPLTLSEARRAELEPYLPEERSSFLMEGPLPVGITQERRELPLRELLPHVTLTYAQSLDSQISLHPGVRTTLSGDETKAMTHYLRSRHDAILIGVGTARADNPSLNTRFSYDGQNVVGLSHQPKPIILDPSKRWRDDLSTNLFERALSGQGRAPLWVISPSEQFLVPQTPEEELEDQVRMRRIEAVGGKCLVAGDYRTPAEGVDWAAVLRALGEAGIRSVMIEGGATVINDLLRTANQVFVDALIVTIAPTYLGSGGAVVSPPRSVDNQNEAILTDIKWLPYGQDVVMAWRRRRLSETGGRTTRRLTRQSVRNGTSKLHQGDIFAGLGASGGPEAANSSQVPHGYARITESQSKSTLSRTIPFPPISPLANEIIRTQKCSESSSDESVDPNAPSAIKAYHTLLHVRNVIDKAITKVDASFQAGRDRDLMQATFARAKSEIEPIINQQTNYNSEQGCSPEASKRALELAKFPVADTLRRSVDRIVARCVFDE